jgi:hypothetical protein
MKMKCCEYNPRKEGLKQTLTIRAVVTTFGFLHIIKMGQKA